MNMLYLFKYNMLDIYDIYIYKYFSLCLFLSY